VYPKSDRLLTEEYNSFPALKVIILASVLRAFNAQARTSLDFPE
jgi:hypothetical protein